MGESIDTNNVDIQLIKLIPNKGPTMVLKNGKNLCKNVSIVAKCKFFNTSNTFIQRENKFFQNGNVKT